jgi:hypothetical protein
MWYILKLQSIKISEGILCFIALAWPIENMKPKSLHEPDLSLQMMALSSYCLWCLKVMMVVDYEDCCILWCDVVYSQLPDYPAPHHRIQQSSWYWLLWIVDLSKLRHPTSVVFSVDVTFSQTCTWIQPATKAHFTLHSVTMSHHWKTDINITGKDKLAENKLITDISYLLSLYPVTRFPKLLWWFWNQ